MTRKTSWLCVLALVAVAPLALADPALAAEAEAGGEQARGEEGAKDEDQKVVYGETIVVTASRSEESVADAPVSVTVITPERLETTPAENFADLFRGVPGLNVIQTSARDFNFTSRGATNTLSTTQLTLVDGRSVYQDFFGFVMWDLIPNDLDEIEQVEILRGPGSAIWGANASNGVINLRTKSPRDLAGGAASLTVGEVGTRGGSFRWAGAGDRWSYKLTGSYLEQDAWERVTTLPSGAPLPPGTSFDNEGTEQPKLSLRADFDPQPDRRWTFEGGLALTSGMVHTGIGPFRVEDSTYVAFGKAAYRRGSMDFNAYLNQLDGEGKNVINGLDFFFDTTTLHGEATDRRAWGDKQVFVYGASARGSFFDLSIAPRDDQRTELGFHLEDQVTLNEHVHLSLGGRADWFDTIGWTFSPRTSLVVKPHQDHSLRFAYNRAYRAPSLVNNYLDTSIPNAVVLHPALPPFVFVTSAVGNADLDEQVLDAFEVAYTVNAADRATLSIAVYRNRTQDVIDFYPSKFYSSADPPAGWPLPRALVPPFTLPKEFTYRNIGEVVDVGVELAADIRLGDGVNAVLSYTWQDEPEVSGVDSPIGLDTNLPPTHQFAASVDFREGRWSGSAGLTFTDEAFWTDVLDQRFWGGTDSYLLFNATLGVRVADTVSLAVKGTNIFDEAAQQHVFGDIIGRRILGEARVDF